MSTKTYIASSYSVMYFTAMRLLLRRNILVLVIYINVVSK